MRAEAQAHIDQINAATELLRRFLDWDRAIKRLDELNAKVEDSALWNDPKAAQDRTEPPAPPKTPAARRRPTPKASRSPRATGTTTPAADTTTTSRRSS